MKKTFILIFSLLFLAFYDGQQDEKTISKNVDQFVNKQMKTLKIPGTAIAVVKKGKIIKKTTYL